MSPPPRIVDVAEGDAGRRLDVLLADRLGESRSRAAARIDRGEVTLDGAPLAKSYTVSPGERIVVAAPPREPTGAAGVAPPPIRYEDEHLLVVAKPAGLVVHPGTGHPAGTLVQALADAGVPLAPAAGEDRPGIVHRLDRDTSGLLLVAKTDTAYVALVTALKRRRVQRRYVALVEGEPASPKGRIEAPLGRDPADRKRFAVIAGGKHAVTRYEVDRVGSVGSDQPHPVALLACELETGRTHQIRVHLSAAGHPVVGDRTYGARRDLAHELGLERFFLHAAALRLAHPVTGVPLGIDEPLPGELVEALQRAGLGPPA